MTSPALAPAGAAPPQHTRRAGARASIPVPRDLDHALGARRAETLVRPLEPARPRARAVPVGWEPRWEPRCGPVPEACLALAQDYQRRTELFTGWRERLVAGVAPTVGDTVLDVGCGPGLNIAALQAAVGPSGTIIAIERSVPLLTVAAVRVARRGWDNVELINADPARVELSLRADAAVFAAAPDVLDCPRAVANILRQLRPDAAVGAGGWKWPTPAWLWPLRIAVALHQRRDPRDPRGYEQPWRVLAAQLADRHTRLHISEVGFGIGYLGHTAPLPHRTDVRAAPGWPQ